MSGYYKMCIIEWTFITLYLPPPTPLSSFQLTFHVHVFSPTLWVIFLTSTASADQGWILRMEMYAWSTVMHGQREYLWMMVSRGSVQSSSLFPLGFLWFGLRVTYASRGRPAVWAAVFSAPLWLSHQVTLSTSSSESLCVCARESTCHRAKGSCRCM